MKMAAIRTDGAAVDGFSQWDTGQQIRVSGINEDATFYMQFKANGAAAHRETDPVQYDREQGFVFFQVPDELLQEAGTLEVLCSETVAKKSNTVHRQIFSIAERDKPDGYVYTPTDIKNYYSLSQRITALELFGGSAEVADAVAEVRTLNQQVKENSAKTEEIAASLSEKLARLEEILNDVESLESQTNRAVAAANAAEEAADRLEELRVSVANDADAAAKCAERAERAVTNAQNIFTQIQNAEKSFNATISSYKTQLLEIENNCTKLEASCDTYADLADRAADRAENAAQRAEKNMTVLTKTNCAFSTKPNYITVNFSEFGLTFTAAPKIVLNNPFSAVDAAAYVLDITKTGFKIYLIHPSASGTVDCTFLVCGE